MTKPNPAPQRDPKDDKLFGITMPTKLLGVKLPGRGKEYPALVWGAYGIFAAVAATWLVFYIIPKAIELFRG